MNRRLNTQQTGFTLLEALVAIVIISIGLLGLISLQTASLQNTQVSANSSQASIAAESMASRMRANMAGVKNGDYDNKSTHSYTPIDCSSISTTVKKNVATYDLKQWYCHLKSVLPNPVGSIKHLKKHQNKDPYRFRITISWCAHHTKNYQNKTSIKNSNLAQHCSKAGPKLLTRRVTL